MFTVKSPLVVPTILVTGSLHFAEVQQDGKAQDVVNALVSLKEITNEIIGDLEDHGWALQRIRVEQYGRTWEEDELEALGDGTLESDTPMAPLVNTATHMPISQRHFSSFSMTSHLHIPVLRLVSLHPMLSINFLFLRIPEIHDGYEYRLFISKSMSVSEVIDAIMEELGLTKSLPIPGGGNIDYVLEEVWWDQNSEKFSRLPASSPMFNFIEFPYSANPFSKSARRKFRICVPDEWYRRSKSRTMSTTSFETSESTIKQLASLQESDEEDEDEGTAKVASGSPMRPAATGTVDWRGSLSQNRLSSLFDGWLHSTSPTSPSRVSTVSSPDNRKSVSEPKLVSHIAGNGLKVGNVNDGIEDDFSEIDFENMLNEMGLKGDKRTRMYELSTSQKQYLLRQNHNSRTKVADLSTKSSQSNQPLYAASYGPSSASALLPRLVPQLTGDAGLMRRFSMAGWGTGGTAPPVISSEPSRSSGEFDSSAYGKGKAHVERVVEEMQPIQPQTTGGLWSSWWASSGGENAATGEKTESRETEKSPRWYVDVLRAGKTTDKKLVKHLISLRVHLSTAKMVWIQGFVVEEKGLDALGTLLEGLVAKGGKRRILNELETSVLLEVIKCLRVLLNTEPGFAQFLSSPTAITHIAYSLHASSLKLRTLSSELLAAICVLSLNDGHKAVLAAMSDYRVAYDEAFRFENLIACLRPVEFGGESENENAAGYGNEEEGVWEARTASMALINALTNCPDSLEDRIILREEFGRRGLNEVIVALRYIKPPDGLLTQLDVYTEEKFEDEEDMRERIHRMMSQTVVKGHERARSDSEEVLEDLITLAKQHGELYPMMVDILNHYGQILQKEVGIQLKADLFTILDRFVQQAALLDNFDDNWHVFLKKFAASVQHITGQKLEVKAVSDVNSRDIVEQELEELRSKVDELSEEKTELRNEINQKIAEINTLKSLPLGIPVPNMKSSGKPAENFHGLVQRLVQKEKQVLQLQSDLERFKAQSPGEGRDADERLKRERDRLKWNTLMDEIAKLKIKNGEIEASISIKDKEIVYLKRALESVYTRFISREEIREENREAGLDAELIATRTIEKLTQKDEQIASLCKEVEELNAKLAAKPKTEKEFKAKSPPPPPPQKPRRTSMPPPTPSLTPLSSPSIPPPPPPPPLPTSQAHLNPQTNVIQSGTPPDNQISSPILPPPPPPPPLPPPPNVVGIPPPPPPPPPPPTSPGTGPPPPPPPPPSAFKMGGKMKINKPAIRLKPFFWNKLTNHAVMSTVWNDITSNIEFNMEDLEANFKIDNTPSSSQILRSPTRKQNVTTLLDITRANNIAIMLSRIKMSFPDIRKALLDLDNEKLSFDDLKAISKQLPTSDEIGRIKDFDDVGKLAKADQYFSQIITIPRLSERIDCMLYRRKLDLDIAEIRPELNILRNASHELRTSHKFKRVLQAVLAVGNALNGSSFRGSARGFQLDALLKMKETKTARGGPDCPTLLHYLARVLMRTDPSLVTFIDDLPNLEPAARVSVQTISQAVNSLVSGLGQIREELKQTRHIHLLPEDQFVRVMQPFVMEVEPSVDALKNMSTALENELRLLLSYYGEDPDSADAPKPEDFFGLVASFSASLQKCALEVHDAQQKLDISLLEPPKEVVEVEEQTSDATLKAAPSPSPQLLMPPHRNSQGYAAGKLSVGRGDLDQAIRSMREGKRRARPTRPLSKMFLDGASGGNRPQSRLYD